MRDKKVGGRTSVGRDAEVAASVPGRQSLVQQSIGPAPVEVQQQAAPKPAAPLAQLPSYASIMRLFGGGSVQAKGGAAGAPDVHAAAAHGVSGPASSLPHLEQIQRSFGKHDVSHVQAHVGAEATAGSKAMGADAFATGDHVAFAGVPSLHIAAHEAAHVVQQRGGIQLAGGVGTVGDTYEQHADQVADLVVQGKCAEELLNQHAGGGGASAAPVQRKEATPDQSPAAQNELPGVGSSVKITPDDVAEFMARRPDLRADILEWAERTEGAAFVQEVLAAERRLAAAAPRPASSTGPATSAPRSATGPGTSEHAAPSTATSPVAPAPSDQFTTLSGNSIARTTPKEAAVLNALRADPRRLDPAWLAVAQRNLGVVDATGAMNTETLRAMRTRAGTQALGADGILNTSFLGGIVPGTPFFESEPGFADHSPDAAARTPADQAAQAVGYASYRDYRKNFVTITFLGRPMIGQGSGEGHPYLAARIKAAEAFLRQRHPGPDGDAGVIKSIGWNGVGNISYADKVGTPFSHQHTMGLAIDIDPSHNPYIFNEHVGGLTHEQSMWWIDIFKEMFRVATKIYGGEAIAPDTLMQWSKEGSSEELFQRVRSASSAFKQYLDLSTKPDDQILATLTGAGYSDNEAKALLPNVKAANGRFHGGSRRDATSITNIQEELLIALRDVAGLSWGGTEMSMRENGDFMHFDCRDTEFGRAVYLKKAPAKRS